MFLSFQERVGEVGKTICSLLSGEIKRGGSEPTFNLGLLSHFYLFGFAISESFVRKG